ncbi:Zinc finger RING-type protein [Ceratobasidium sp. AG-Ba]|nr:Zinc finger RING-type protein [Ceratobasidium sp. AG-Ba]
MGSQQSTPTRRNPIRSRTLSRILRQNVDNDHHAQSVRRASAPAPAPSPAQGQAQGEEDAAPPAPRSRSPPRQGHLGGDAHLVRRHSLDRPHQSLDQQAPATPQTRTQASQEGATAPDRARCEALATASSSTRETAATAAARSGDAGGPALLPEQVTLTRTVDPGARASPEPNSGATRTEETSATSTSSAPTAASIPPQLPAPQLSQLNEQHPVLSSPSLATSAFATAPSTPPPVSPSSPTAATSNSTIPRTLPLGTTMIVQGLVQTIEVPRSSSSTRTSVAPTDPTDNVIAPEVEPIRPGRPPEDAKPSIESGDPPTSPSTLATPPMSESPTPSTSSTPSPGRTPSPEHTPSTTPPDTPPLSSSASSNTPLPSSSTPIPAPTVRPATTSGSSSPPSSTDVLGLLLSIAAQATAEALVPWSVPPRSRNLGPSPPSSGTSENRNGIANGLAAAFSALAAGGARQQSRTEDVETPPPAPVSAPVSVPAPASSPAPIVVPAPHPRPRPAANTRRFSTLSTHRTSIISNRRASIADERDASRGRRRTMSMLGDTVRRFMPWRSPSGPEREEREEEVADFARAPPGGDVPPPIGEDTQVPVSPVEPALLPPLPTPTVLAPPPPPSPTLPRPPTPALAPPPPPPSPPRATTDAEDLVRFSHMLGFTPGAVHPVGSFERFLSDMQDELRAALSEYQERTRPRESRSARERERQSTTEGEEGARLDHTRSHVPSTDPLPLNWWRMYRFAALPDVTVPASGTNAQTVTRDSAPTSEAPVPDAPDVPAVPNSDGPASAPGEAAPVPVHPAIIIGLRSVSRDSVDDAAATAAGAGVGAGIGAGAGPTRRSAETRRTTPSAGADTEPRRSSMGDASWARRFGLREGEEAEDNRRGTRNYIIWIIGGYYASNHPLLAHPNLFLGQVHPDELWMLNEFLGQVKPPTASREDIAKAGLRVIKGHQVEEFAKDGGVTENCTERCLICLDDYEEEQDLRIMSCKHMFHKDCVDRWMETGRNNCPACRTKGVDTTSSSPSPPTSTTTQV